MKNHGPFLTAIFALLIIACSPRTTSVTSTSSVGSRTTLLPDLMIGSFDSSAQAKSDSTYYDITLHMYPIWPDEPIIYLYVEQTVTSMPMKPYRQRVYKVELLEDGAYKSSVYKLAHDSVFIGKWKEPKFFENYSSSDLMEREGCAVYMKPIGDGSYNGSTRKQDCKSTMRGAAYATSFVEVAQGRISSWDQGFDAGGEQVWGATEGPYIFLKK